MGTQEFQEIGHCGGQVTFDVTVSPEGRIGFQVGIRHCRPTAAAFFAIYALPPGIPVGPLNFGGIGAGTDAPPMPGCLPVFIASDTEGMFGFQCPKCEQYWRARNAVYCPYCATRAERHNFLTDAQRNYVSQYCARLEEVLEDGKAGIFAIDMDAVADAAGKDSEKPPFYYAEESQQNKFACEACGEVNDILGRYGYCSTCRTRNDVQEFAASISNLRQKIVAGGPYESCVTGAVSLFDSFTNQIATQLLAKVPLTKQRRHQVEKRSLHKLEGIAEVFRTVYGIELLGGINDEELKFATLMFYRRHVYEHNGGEADEKYIAESGDSVRIKQTLHETSESAHRLATIVLKIASNMHAGFHEIIPPAQDPADRFSARRSRQ